MKRILYSQHESAIKDDYFVIDGELELNNVSDLSMEAFKIVNSIEDWKILYQNQIVKILRQGKFLGLKSHYINEDESGRLLFYIYYFQSNDIEKMLNNLESDSRIINKQLPFETKVMLAEIKKKGILKTVILILIVALASFILWKIAK